jgi:hypothetical protein
VSHCGNARSTLTVRLRSVHGFYLQLNAKPTITLTSRGDQVSAGVLRKNIRRTSRASTARYLLVKSVSVVETKRATPECIVPACEPTFGRQHAESADQLRGLLPAHSLVPAFTVQTCMLNICVGEVAVRGRRYWYSEERLTPRSGGGGRRGPASGLNWIETGFVTQLRETYCQTLQLK